MKTYKAAYWVNGKVEEELVTSDKSKLRRFFSQVLPSRFNSIAHCGWMIGELEDHSKAERRWRTGEGLAVKIHKLTLEVAK